MFERCYFAIIFTTITFVARERNVVNSTSLHLEIPVIRAPETTPILNAPEILNSSCARLTYRNVDEVQQGLNGPFSHFEVFYEIFEVPDMTGVRFSQNISSAFANSTQVCGLRAFTKHQFYLRVWNTKYPGEIAQSYRTKTSPAAPEMMNDFNVQLKSTDLPSSVTLNFTEFKDEFKNSNDEIFLRFLYKKMGSVEVEMVKDKSTDNGLTVSLPGMQPLTNYSVQVVAFSTFGDSERSQVFSIFTGPAPPYGGPEITSIVNEFGGESALISIDFPRDLWNSKEISTYTITFNKSKNSDDSQVFNASLDASNVTGLAPYTYYAFTVHATNEMGNGPEGRPFLHRSGEGIPEGEPTNIVLTNISYYSIGLEWGPVEAGETKGNITSYVVGCETGGPNQEPNTTIMVYERKALVEDLQPETTYWCHVKACTKVGCGPCGNEKGETTSAVPSEGAEISFGEYVNSTSIYVEWEDITKWGKEGYKGFCAVALYEGEEKGKVCTDHAVRSTYFYGLEAYTLYEVKVQGVNDIGGGVFGGVLAVTTDQLPPAVAPANRTFIDSQSNSLEFSWGDLVPQNYRGVITGYTLRAQAVGVVETDAAYFKMLKQKRAIEPLSSWDLEDYYTGPLKLEAEYNVTDSAATSAVVGNLFSNIEYNITISANTKYQGVFSRGDLNSTKEGVPLFAAMNVRCSGKSENSFSFEWTETPPLFMQGTWTTYNISFRKLTSPSESASYETLLDFEMTTFHAFDLLPLTEYEVNMTAYTTKGASPVTTIVCPTGESVPSAFPSHLNATTMHYPRASLLDWSPIPEQFWRGQLRGYLLKYRRTRHSERADIFSEWKIVNVTSLNTTFLLRNLTVFSTYLVRVAGYTAVGPGAFSPPAQFDTCRVHHPTIHVEYYNFRPFFFTTDDGKTVGILVNSVTKSLLSCAEQCTSFKRQVDVKYTLSEWKKYHNFTSARSEAIRIPMSDPGKANAEGAFSKTLVTPGFMLLGLSKSKLEIVTEKEFVLMTGLFDSLVFLIPYLLVNCLFGVFFFFVEPKNLNERGSSYSLSALFEGVYLAIMTSTTVGYGDKVPVTLRGRMYITAWTFVGLVLTSIAIGNITSSLSAVVISTISVVYPKDLTLVKNQSPEMIFAKGKLEIYDEELFEDHDAVIRALVDGKATQALIEQYVFDSMKETLVENNLTLIKSFPSSESKYGMVLGETYAQLSECVAEEAENHKKAIEDEMKSVQMDMNNKVGEAPIGQQISEEEVKLVSWMAPIYQLTLLVLLIAYAVLFLAGCVYEIQRRMTLRKEQARVTTSLDRRLALRDELREFTRAYHAEYMEMVDRLTKTTDRLLFKHGEQLLALTKRYSKMYGVNFKYVRIADLGVSLEEIAQYKRESEMQPKTPKLQRALHFARKKVLYVKHYLGF